MVKSLLILISLSISTATFATRGEIKRFTLLHDRMMIDRSLRLSPHGQFFNIDLAISSGLRSLISDVSNTSENSSSSAAAKQLETFKLLSKNVNTEKFIDLYAGFGIPLPDIKIKKHKLYTSLFYELNAGIMVTIANQDDPTNPQAQTYVRKELKTGLSILYKPEKDKALEFSLYQLTRSDSASNLTSANLAQDGEFFNLDSLNQDHIVYALDFQYARRTKTGQFKAGVREFKLMSSSGEESLYGSDPLLFTQFQWKPTGRLIRSSLFAGIHYRGRYSVDQGIYLGTHLSVDKKTVPIDLTVKVSSQFITLMPVLKLKWFNFSYSFKNPYRNPQDEVWVSSLHNIQLTLPFP
jgi:hypothetical protein